MGADSDTLLQNSSLNQDSTQNDEYELNREEIESRYSDHEEMKHKEDDQECIIDNIQVILPVQQNTRRVNPERKESEISIKSGLVSQNESNSKEEKVELVSGD